MTVQIFAVHKKLYSHSCVKRIGEHCVDLMNMAINRWEGLGECLMRHKKPFPDFPDTAFFYRTS